MSEVSLVLVHTTPAMRTAVLSRQTDRSIGRGLNRLDSTVSVMATETW